MAQRAGVIERSRFSRKVIVLPIVFALLGSLTGCAKNPASVEQDREFVFCWQVLSLFSIYQERLPEDPFEYETPKDLYESIDDPYTRYIDSSQAATFMQMLTTRTGGIGIILDTAAGHHIVWRVFPGSPGEQAGLLPGDTLVSIDGAEVTGLPRDSLSAMIPDEIGSRVSLVVKRADGSVTITVTIGEYYAPSVFTDTIDTNTAYILLTEFSDSTGTPGGSSAEFQAALDATSWARFTVLDLRHNPGGLENQCVGITSQFVEENTVITKKRERVYREELGRAVTIDTALLAGEGQKALTRRFAVLVDAYTASAAELLVNCLKERRASTVRIIGSTTYGKGSGWNLWKTPRAGLITVTGMLVIPVINPVYNLEGIDPDIALENVSDAEQVALELFRDGGLGKRGMGGATRIAQVLDRYAQLERRPWFPRLVTHRK